MAVPGCAQHSTALAMMLSNRFTLCFFFVCVVVVVAATASDNNTAMAPERSEKRRERKGERALQYFRESTEPSRRADIT